MTLLLPTRRGAALVIALAIMVLILALVVGLLSRVSTERTASGGYAATVAAKLLADTAVQIVQAQVDAATTQGEAWTSQPGLVRTFTVAGVPSKSYKLYSDGGMQVSGALVATTEAAKLTAWFSSPAHFTDLNMPSDTDFDGTSDRWPILDPSAVGVVEGFSLTSPPIGNSTGVTNPAPMPARWLYVLEDGQVVAPSGTGDVATVSGASSSNPIVGRIAFWTDDETCKVNVNTASEGSYWDVPRGWSPSERFLAEYQPTNREFQGYPGHPATTSLSPVFPELTRDELFALVPRLQNGGSRNMTVSVATAGNVTLDTDRLYATPDEMLFTVNRTAQLGLAGNQSLVERGKFFLTTTSRAPETNLFNLPRIVSWPLHGTDSTFHRSAFDRLIAFCGTLNGYEYYFMRRNPNSTVEDYVGIPRNRTLISYLRTLTDRPTPGFGGTLATKFGADRDQILTQILDYLRITNVEDGNLQRDYQYAPGTAESGTGLGNFGRGQVLPLTIDFGGNNTTRGFGRVPVVTEVGLWLICTADAGNATSNNATLNRTLPPGVNLTMNGTAKQIRVEAALVLEPFIPTAGYKNVQPDLEITVSGLENWRIRGNDPGDLDQTMGFPSLAQQTRNDAGRYVSGSLLTYSGVYPRGGHAGVWSFLGKRGLRARNAGRLTQDSRFSNLAEQYPFVGEPVTLSVGNSTARVIFNGGSIQINVAHRLSGAVLQTYNVDFPSGTFAVPQLRTNPDATWTFQASGSGTGSPGNEGRFFYSPDRLPTPSFAPPYYFQGLTPAGSSSLSDIVRTVLPGFSAGGVLEAADFRHLAMKQTIPSSVFAKHPFYDDVTAPWRVSNSFVQSDRGHEYHFGRNPGIYASRITDLGGASISLAQGVNSYGQYSHPDVVFPANTAQATGDWDNGVGTDIDGPYLNKPDEGVAYSSTGTNIPYFHSSNTTFDVEKFYAPNRIIPSPGMFGSLPTGVKRNLHWQTLLFRRQPGHPSHPAANGTFLADPDFLMLDLFWMPVVEPYAISEPLSTAGKVNMNQQIVPFSWIERNTGLRAVLKNEKVVAIASSQAATYKKNPNLAGPFSSENFRQAVSLNATLTQFTQRLTNADGTGLYAFRAPAEICDIHIVPGNATVDTSSKAALDASMATFWSNHALTGDNSRERIYTTVYPRLTTRSNTFTVHYRVQVLKQRPGADPGIWDDATGIIASDDRGSRTIERYIDPNNPAIPDYGSDPDATPELDSFYRWRVRSNRPFVP
jgi:uncharacterized protein (TIGR02600 family)